MRFVLHDDVMEGQNRRCSGLTCQRAVCDDVGGHDARQMAVEVRSHAGSLLPVVRYQIVFEHLRVIVTWYVLSVYLSVKRSAGRLLLDCFSLNVAFLCPLSGHRGILLVHCNPESKCENMFSANQQFWKL